MSVQFAEGNSSKPSVADLASFASRAKEIDIGGDDIVELGDDLGVNLMANPNKIAPSPRGQRQVNFGSPSGSSGVPQIQIKPIDDLDVVNLDAAPGNNDIHVSHAQEAPFVINTGSSSSAPVEMQGSGMSAEQENL